LGLAPGNPNGTYLQAVPMTGHTPHPTLSFTTHGRTLPLEFGGEYVAMSHLLRPDVAGQRVPVVFAGYGIVAPEYGWDDYKDVDVRGKLVLMLAEDPPLPDPRDSTRLDPLRFKGATATYRGFSQSKRDEAARHGAAAVLIINNPARVPLQVYLNSARAEQFDLAPGPNEVVPAAFDARLGLATVQRLADAAGLNLTALLRQALQPGFRSVPLGDLTADFSLHSDLRQINSRNVVARLPGSDPQLKDEYVVYTSHWDHVGRDRSRPGDQIFNGAADNAAGTAQMLEMAGAFARLKVRPKRSILFIATTAEEQGLLGSRYYCQHPLYPLARTVANINHDGASFWGPTRDVINVGAGLSALDEPLRAAAAMQGRRWSADPYLEEAFFYRSDQFPFAQAGVPAAFPSSGDDVVDRPAGYAQARFADYFAHDYHQPSDEIKPDWNLAGAALDAQWLLLAGYLVAQNPAPPQWQPGAEFSRPAPRP
ncbi:MAG: M20/M25/M40 family metallo-hydrolase, partial [Hymenobacter sp.]|nr:M20/M25/M40 family metallo-hydrolase [Hymenobacter sp.]